VAVIVDGATPRVLEGVTSVRALAKAAIAEGTSLQDQIAAHGSGSALDLSAVTLLPPIDHDDRHAVGGLNRERDAGRVADDDVGVWQNAVHRK
jgi:hypothetical protein